MCVLQSQAANTCDFYYALSGVGPSCVMKGGLPSALIDKYEDLFGGVYGLKLIVDDKKGLSKMTQDEFSKLQREQQIYSQNINQIGNDIQTVKHILGIFPISPPVDESPGTKSKIIKRAVDPNKAMRDALRVAETTLANMTRNMEDSARRRSMMFSSAEQRIQQQDLRLMSIRKKIADLEKLAAQLPGTPQAISVSSPSFNTIQNIATISAKIQATTEIIKARVADLNERLREMNKPIQERVKNYQKLDNDLKILQSGVSKLDKDAASLSTAYTKTKNDITQDVSSLQQNMSNVQTLYTTVKSDENRIQAKIQQADAKIQQDKRTLQQTSASLTQMKTTLTTLDPTLKNITNGITAFKQDPVVQLAQLRAVEIAAKTKLEKDIKQTEGLGKAVGNLLKLQQMKLTNLPG